MGGDGPRSNGTIVVCGGTIKGDEHVYGGWRRTKGFRMIGKE